MKLGISEAALAAMALNALGACSSHLVSENSLASCTIGGTSFAARDHNPENLNQCCLPSLNTTGWSDWFQDGGQIALGDGGEGWWSLGDFNGDGKQDLVYGGVSSVGNAGLLGGVLVHVNGGNGSFLPLASYSFAAPTPSQLFGTALDLNGDGYDDLILGWFGCCAVVPNVQVLLNQRDGTFGAPIEIQDTTTLWELIPGDVNGDGIPDLFSTGYADAGVQLRIGSGNGSFDPPIALDTGFGDASVVEIDVASMRGNNLLDLVTFYEDGSDQGTAGIGVSLGDGKGHFAPPIVYEPNSPGLDGFKVVDFDGDGFPDVMVFDRFPNVWAGHHTSMGVLHGNGDGTLGPFQKVDLDPASIDAWPQSAQLSPGTSDLVGDSDYPGDAGLGSSFSQVNVYWRLGDGGLSPPFPVGPPSPYFANYLVRDLNGDGAKDIISVSGGFDPTIGYVYLNACGAPPK